MPGAGVAGLQWGSPSSGSHGFSSASSPSLRQSAYLGHQDGAIVASEFAGGKKPAPPGGAPFGAKKRSHTISMAARPRQPGDRYSGDANVAMRKSSSVGSPNEWKSLLEIDTVQGHEQDELTRQEEIRKRQELRRFLDGQCRQKKRAKDAEVREWKEWGSRLQEDADLFRFQERHKLQQGIEAKRAFNDVRGRLLEDKQRRLRDDKEVERRMDQQMFELLAASAKQEAAAAQEKENKLQSMKNEIEESRRAQFAHKTLTLRTQGAMDTQVMDQQRQMLDGQERTRRTFYEVLKSKKPPDTSVRAAEHARELNHRTLTEENRYLRFKAEREAREDAAIEAKKRQKAHQTLEEKTIIREKMQENSVQLKREQEEGLREAAQFGKAAVDAESEERERIAQKREKERSRCTFLQSQTEQRSTLVPGKFGHEKMSDTEKRMNMGTLGDVRDDHVAASKQRSWQLQAQESRRSLQASHIATRRPLGEQTGSNPPRF
eukprot:TRINITY_DN68536_c0_g1_i1.p1 TRINITY_DN68536_c0_g1~~TRINITY_DN68536_c0_g1_i1.p1  ORF type:complete len:490 (-),score=114.94 TRINITY_DN68536_c0_g1_i1:70-1539(-)